MSRKGKKDFSAFVIPVVNVGRPMLRQTSEFVFQFVSYSFLAAKAKSTWSKQLLKNEVCSGIKFFILQHLPYKQPHATNLIARKAKVFYELQDIPVVQIKCNSNAFLTEFVTSKAADS